MPYALHANTADSITGTINYTETDPVFGTSIAAGITAADTANWNNHTVDTDTHIDSTGIAALGYIAGQHADSTTITNMGFVAGPHTIDNNGIYDGSGTVPAGTAVTLTDNINFGNNTSFVDGSSNRVGVGTITPLTPLHVTSNSITTPELTIENTSNNRSVTFNSNGEIEAGTSGQTLYLNRYADGNVVLANGGGKVGIGTNAPMAVMQISNNVASGALDNFNEYQLLLYEDNVNAVRSYGLGIRSGTFVYNSYAYHDFDIQGVTAIRIDTAGIVQEPWQNATLQNGWVNYGGGYVTCQYYKDKEGVIHVKGLINSGATSVGTVLFTLPPGYRPNERRIMTAMYGNGYGAFCRIDVLTNGNVVINSSVSNWINLEFSFRP